MLRVVPDIACCGLHELARTRVGMRRQDAAHAAALVHRSQERFPGNAYCLSVQLDGLAGEGYIPGKPPAPNHHPHHGAPGTRPPPRPAPTRPPPSLPSVAPSTSLPSSPTTSSETMPVKGKYT